MPDIDDPAYADQPEESDEESQDDASDASSDASSDAGGSDNEGVVSRQPESAYGSKMQPWVAGNITADLPDGALPEQLQDGYVPFAEVDAPGDASGSDNESSSY